MPYKVTQLVSTPNPNAVKCILDRAIREPGAGSVAWRSALSASGDPAAAAIFEIRGVNNLLFNSDWITVGKAADADWKSIMPQVKRVLERLP